LEYENEFRIKMTKLHHQKAKSILF